MSIEEKYDLLSPENKIEFQKFIETLAKGQYIPVLSSGSLR